MKNTILIAILIASLHSCELEPGLPQVVNDINQIETTTTINDLMSDYLNQDQLIQNLDPNEIFRGFVVSSDSKGNFFKEIIIQNNLTSSYGLRIRVDVNDISETFEPGRVVYINTNGLSLTFQDNEFILGIEGSNEIDRIPETQVYENIKRTNQTVNLIPETLTVDDINNIDLNLPGNKINTFIKLNNLQLPLESPNSTFASAPNDNFEGERLLTECTSLSNITLSTSTFATFKGSTIPNDNFSISGILLRDFENNKFIIKINNLDDIVINENTPRCDPISNENFESYPLGVFTNDSWTNFAVEGDVLFDIYNDTSQGKSIRLNPFNQGNTNVNSWLILPEFNGTENSISFDTSNSFADNSSLLLYYSTNWDGNDSSIENANWILLDANIVQDTVNFQIWVNSGNIDVSFIDTPFHIGFQFLGDSGNANSSNNGTYEIDNISIF